MNSDTLFNKALHFEFLAQEEGQYLFSHAPTAELMMVAHEMRMKLHPEKIVTWIIDRNVNTTNVCIANCKFCNFYRIPGHPDSYITAIEEYKKKIVETFRFGGEQLLLQGGHHPDLGLKFYTDLFRELKKLFPKLKLHALGPPEVAHITKLENSTHTEVLKALKDAGLDSLPGAGAEILSDRVRRLISKGKCSGREWLDVMRAAHQLHITTSATMMFGHVETLEERFQHLVWLREVQSEKPKDAKGFLAFIPWTFQDVGTMLARIIKRKASPTPPREELSNTQRSGGFVRGTFPPSVGGGAITGEEYIRTIAISRIMLPNIRNIQASWLTVGKEVAQVCLHAGANDFGSIMIEENVVSAAGAPHRFTSNGMQAAIREAGFEPQLRNQQYENRELPEMIEQQQINY